MPGALAPGVYIQVFRQVVPGKTRPERLALLATKLDEWKAAGVVGVAWHGFYNDLDGDAFAPLAELCHVRGMKALAAYGLGSVHPADSGEWIGQVAKRSDCDGVIVDCEGAWENQVSDKAAARTMGKAIRDAAPDALVIDQPWFAAASHWSMFPWEEFAEYVDVRAPQVYVNDFAKQYGKQRYDKVWAWYERDWKKLETRLAPQGLAKPRIVTLQGYGWSDIPADLEHCLATNETAIVWCEPWPKDDVLAAIKSAHEKRCVSVATVASKS